MGVLGSGSQAHEGRAAEIGRWLAGEGFHLLTGGGSGVMAAVSRAFYEVESRSGLVIGILPGVEGNAYARRSPEGYPNKWVEIPIYTHLPTRGDRGEEDRSRNHINVLSSNLLIALPGGPGTASEVRLALRYRRPLIAYLGDRGEIPGLPAETPVEFTFEAVRRFVLERLAVQNAPGQR